MRGITRRRIKKVSRRRLFWPRRTGFLSNSERRQRRGADDGWMAETTLIAETFLFNDWAARKGKEGKGMETRFCQL